MSDSHREETVIRHVLNDSRTWAFVGLRDNPGRTAHEIARLVRSHGKTIVPVHPAAETVLGEPGVASLAEVRGKVDVVGVYRNTTHAGEVADDAIKLFTSYGPREDGEVRAVWFPLDVVDEAAAQRVRDAGIDVVMDRCPAIEWPRL